MVRLHQIGDTMSPTRAGETPAVVRPRAHIDGEVKEREAKGQAFVPSISDHAG